MYDGLVFQRMIFERLFIATKDTINENGGYIRPIAHLFWQDGNHSEVALSEDDEIEMASSTLKIAQFLRDIDLFCVKEDVFVAYICFPLDMPKYYCCILTGLQWAGSGLCRSLYFENGKLIEVEHDIERYDEIFKELRFKAIFHDTNNMGRA